MAAAKELIRGDTWLRQWTLTDKNQQPISLTGASARLQVRDSSGELILNANTTTGELIITPLEGRVNLRVDAEETRQWAVGKYKFDLEITDAYGVVKTYEQNTLPVKADVTI